MKPYVRFLVLSSLLIGFLLASLLTLKPFYSPPSSSSDSCSVGELPEGEYLVTKVIDGDTFMIEGGKTVRIWGIDADERDHPCYSSAKTYLETLILNKKVFLKKVAEEKDPYCRFLRQVFLKGEDVALDLLERGEVVVRGGSEDYIRAENKAREKEVGCKWQKLPIVRACEANSFGGQRVYVIGKVASTKRTSKAIFLNLEKPYPEQCFTVVIFSSSFSNFPFSPEKEYLHKEIKVVGVVELYKGKPEIIVTHPSQVEILK